MALGYWHYNKYLMNYKRINNTFAVGAARGGGGGER